MRQSQNKKPDPEILFYDGDCGVCHWAVGFVARHDPDGQAFRFAALGGSTFRDRLAEPERVSLPDSIVVIDRQGKLLTRSSAVVHILSRLALGWRVLGRLLRIIPRPARDLGYDLFARTRHRWARQPEGTCPVLPPELRGRFDP